jgi:hypothetical protein
MEDVSSSERLRAAAHRVTTIAQRTISVIQKVTYVAR